MNIPARTNKKGSLWMATWEWLIVLVVLVLISLLSLHSYLIFHSLVETFVIVITTGTFFIAWNVRRYADNSYLLFIGIGFIFISLLHVLHMLTYKGMGVIIWDEPTNLPTQLWIASRYLTGLIFLIAFVFIKPPIKERLTFAFFITVTALIVLSIFYWRIFPACFTETTGLTAFKIISEYVIAGLFLIAAIALYRKRKEFDRTVYSYLMGTMLVSIAAEISFTQYVNVYGFANLLGHCFIVIAFYMLYKAIIQTGLTQPYSLLFRNLKKSEANLELRAAQLAQINATLVKEKQEREQIERELTEYRKHLEDLVSQRTAQLMHSNSQLEIEINEKQRIAEELRTLSKRTMEALEEDRQIISRELHDETGQSLTVLNLLLTNIKRTVAQGKTIAISQLEEAQQVVKEVMGQIRALSTNLHPSMLDNIGLIGTLVWYIAEFSKRTGIQINFDPPPGELQLPPKVRLIAYRIIQESLTNITRYAGVSEAFIQIRVNGNVLQIYIEDEGKGFNINSVSTSSSGIRGMRERALSIGGSLDISSIPGRGTTIEVSLPIEAETPDESETNQ
jgi:signal transduction histidine kinase